MPSCKLLQGHQGVVNHDEARTGEGFGVGLTADHKRTDSIIIEFFYIFMAIISITGQGEEQCLSCRNQLTAVGEQVEYLTILTCTHQTAANDFRYLFD